MSKVGGFKLRHRRWRHLAMVAAGACGLVMVAGIVFFSGGTPAQSTPLRIPFPGRPFSVATTAEGVWILQRPLPGCTGATHCWVGRIDPGSNKLDAKRILLPGDAWHITAGAGSLWVSQFDGRLVRIDPRSGSVTARISARPVYFGSVATYGGGFVWTGNDDERNHGGSVSKIDPATNRVVGHVRGLVSPQSIGFGAGSVWVADHAGFLAKIDPDELRIIARRRLGFGAHGVVANDRAVYVADAHGARLLEFDPKTLKARRISTLAIGSIHPVLAAGAMWASPADAWSSDEHSPNDASVLRISTETLRVTDVWRPGGVIGSVAFGFDSVWATDSTGAVVRIRVVA